MSLTVNIALVFRGAGRTVGTVYLFICTFESGVMELSLRKQDLKHCKGSKACVELFAAFNCDNYESSYGILSPALPSNIDSTYALQELLNMDSFLRTQSEKEDLMNRFLSDRLSSPFTLLLASHKCNRLWETKNEITMHVVGASIFEMMGIIKWE